MFINSIKSIHYRFSYIIHFQFHKYLFCLCISYHYVHIYRLNIFNHLLKKALFCLFPSFSNLKLLKFNRIKSHCESNKSNFIRFVAFVDRFAFFSINYFIHSGNIQMDIRIHNFIMFYRKIIRIYTWPHINLNQYYIHSLEGILSKYFKYILNNFDRKNLFQIECLKGLIMN